MAFLQDRKFFVGGKPVLVLSGEIHYFRLTRAEWPDRIRKAKQAGCNAIASYIPWMFHQEVEGPVDLTGLRIPEHDLGAFIDLCQSEGLWFVARPGPFVMGEVKNEGIPDWIYLKCPRAIPTTWEGKRVTSKTLSYLEPEFLKAVNLWYRAVGSILHSRLEPQGGNVIAVQLDNEIGMLQCWTEEADLSEDVLCEFAAWVQLRRSYNEIIKTYGADLGDPFTRAQVLRDSVRGSALTFHSDYTEFTRDRFARYAKTLRTFAEAAGVKGVPFILNIHGSGGGHATTYPIGISQTYRAYTQADDYWGASDLYLGELTRDNIQDLYFSNAFMASVNRPHQPLSSMEFEVGTGDYGENGAVRQSGSAADFKARLSVVQGNRLLNHYLLAGGRNPMLEHPKKDGNGRLGTTGERHGFAAPIDPEGRLDPTYYALRETNRTLGAVGHLLCRMSEEHDGISLGFVPDYYSTDVKPAGPMRELASKLESARGPLASLTRSMLACGLSFPAVNLQAPIPPGTHAIALATAQCLHRDVQQALLEFVSRGGNLILYGDLPIEDLEGHSTTILMDALGIKGHAAVLGSADFFPSVKGVGWATDQPEVRVWRLPGFEARESKPFLKVAQSDLLAGAMINYGKGQVVVVTTELPLHLSLWRRLFEESGVEPSVLHDGRTGGVILNRVSDSSGQRFISLINLDQEDKEVRITDKGEPMFQGPVFLPSHRAKLLPINIRIAGLKVQFSTAEICEVKSNAIALRQSSVPERIAVEENVKIDVSSTRIVKAGAGFNLVEITPGSGEVWIHRA